jgi:hypothetical protein
MLKTTKKLILAKQLIEFIESLFEISQLLARGSDTGT